MNYLHPSTLRHFYNVFPEIPELKDVFASHRVYADQPGAWATAITERQLNQELFDDPNNVIIFWKRIPSQLPFRTEASVVLRLVDEINPKPSRTKDDESFREFKRYASRPDLVVAYSNFQRDRISQFARRTSFAPSGFYNKRLMGVPEWSTNKKRWKVMTVGELFGRREKLIKFVREKVGAAFHVHVNDSFSAEFRESANQSEAVLYLASHDLESLPFGLASRMAATSATFITDCHDIFPFEGDEYYKIPDSGSDSREYKYVVREEANILYQVDRAISQRRNLPKYLHARMSSLSSETVMVEWIVGEVGHVKKKKVMQQLDPSVPYEANPYQQLTVQEESDYEQDPGDGEEGDENV